MSLRARVSDYVQRITLVLLVLFPALTFAQTSCPKETISEEDFDTILNTQFTRILSGEAKGKIGNLAAIDTKDSRLTLNGSSKIGRKNNIVSINASAGVTEGTSSLFSNSKVNPSVSFDVKYHFMSRIFGKQSVTRKCSEVAQYKLDSTKVHQQYLRALENNRYTLGNLTRNLIILRDTITALSDTIRTDSLVRNPTNAVRKRLMKHVDVRKKMALAYDSILRQSRTFDQEESDAQLLRESLKKIETLKDKVVPSGYAFSWFSIGYKLVSKNFFTYDSSLALADQVDKENFTAHQISLEWNRIKFGRKAIETGFFTIGAGILLDDTKDALTKTELTDSHTYKSGVNSRVESTKYSAYTGDYKKDIRSMRFYGDFYQFILRSKFIAAHLYPDATFRKDMKPITNLGVGLFFSFTDKNDKDGKAKVNAELYCKFNDLNNSLEKKNYKFYERNDIGIRVAFPIKFYP